MSAATRVSAIADHAVEREAPHLRRLEQLRVEARHLAPRPVDALAQRGVELGLRDRLAGDLGDGLLVAAGEAAVALDAEEDERREDQQHAARTAGRACDGERNRTSECADGKKANRGSPFVEEAGILAERVRSAGRGAGIGVVGAEGLEPPTYAL